MGELMVRMMCVGENNKGPVFTEHDKQVLNEACSDWHDMVRIYNNRDFHTWFVSSIITGESNKIVSSACLGASAMVLGMRVLSGDLSLKRWVMLMGALRSWNLSWSTLHSYYFSVPEGYICLLYLTKLCNMPDTSAGTA